MLVAHHYSVGLGHVLILADIGFAAFEVDCLGAGELARTHSLTDAGPLVGLAGILMPGVSVWAEAAKLMVSRARAAMAENRIFFIGAKEILGWMMLAGGCQVARV